MPTVVKPDPYSAVLLDSKAIDITNEQNKYLMDILNKACADSLFAKKAYVAITHLFTAGSVKAPVITSLTPNSAEIGDPTFVLHVHGTNFTSGSVIVFNAGDEPTTFVSETEITTGINMSTVTEATTVPVHVRSSDGVLSDPVMFTFTEGIPITQTGGTQLPAQSDPAVVAKQTTVVVKK
jgi:hypothetical protein